MHELAPSSREAERALGFCCQQQLRPPLADWWVDCPEPGAFFATSAMSISPQELGYLPCDRTQRFVQEVPIENVAYTTFATEALDFSVTIPLGAGLSAPGLASLFTSVNVRPFQEASVVAGVRGFVPEEPTVQAAARLRALLSAIGGSVDQLAELLSVSRRSVYNWLNGRPLKAAVAARIGHLAGVLAPLTEEWHPQAVGQWLREGSPSPAELARGELWVDLEERVRSVLRPIHAQMFAESDEGSGDLEALSPEALRAALATFASPPPSTARESGDWQPREFTGTSPDDDER
jgi:transcriptional regulator with XRE-family HTH domain